MQLQMCLIYFSAGGLKFAGEYWQKGTAMYAVVQEGSLYGGYFNPDWMFGYTIPLQFLTYSTLVIETAAIVFLWFQETRIPTLILVMAFHFGIDASMSLNCFHWIMMVGWCSFLIQPDTTHPVNLASLIQAVSDRWNSFFYSRTTSMREAAFLRIAYSVVMFVNLWMLSLDFDYFIRVMPTKAARRTVDPDTWSIFVWFPDGERGIVLLRASLYLWMFQTVLLGLGVAPRFQAFSAFQWYSHFTAQNSILWNGEDTVMRLLAFFMTFFPPNDGYTIFDAFSKTSNRGPKSWPMVSLET
jgi:hypothetical protein